MHPACLLAACVLLACAADGAHIRTAASVELLNQPSPPIGGANGTSPEAIMKKEAEKQAAEEASKHPSERKPTPPKADGAVQQVAVEKVAPAQLAHAAEPGANNTEGEPLPAPPSNVTVAPGAKKAPKSDEEAHPVEKAPVKAAPSVPKPAAPAAPAASAGSESEGSRAPAEDDGLKKPSAPVETPEPVKAAPSVPKPAAPAAPAASAGSESEGSRAPTPKASGDAIDEAKKLPKVSGSESVSGKGSDKPSSGNGNGSGSGSGSGSDSGRSKTGAQCCAGKSKGECSGESYCMTPEAQGKVGDNSTAPVEGCSAEKPFVCHSSKVTEILITVQLAPLTKAELADDKQREIVSDQVAAKLGVPKKSVRVKSVKEHKEGAGGAKKALRRRLLAGADGVDVEIEVSGVAPDNADYTAAQLNKQFEGDAMGFALKEAGLNVLKAGVAKAATVVTKSASEEEKEKGAADATARKEKYERCIGQCPRAYCFEVCKVKGCTGTCERQLPKDTDKPCQAACALAINDSADWKDVDISAIDKMFRSKSILAAQQAHELAKKQLRDSVKGMLSKNVTMMPKLVPFSDAECGNSYLLGKKCPALHGCLRVDGACMAGTGFHDTHLEGQNAHKGAAVGMLGKDEDVIPATTPGIKFEVRQQGGGEGETWGDGRERRRGGGREGPKGAPREGRCMRCAGL